MSIGSERARELLKTSSFLGGLPNGLLDALACRVRVSRFAKGETIFSRGEAGDSLMILLSGQIKITNVTLDGREIILNFLGKGDIIGEIALLDGRPRTADATALEPTEALVLRRRDLLPILNAYPEAMLELIAILCDKLRAASAVIEENTLPMIARTAAGLLRLCDQHGRVVKAGTLIDLKLSQSDLGNYCGLSRENVNRQLGYFRTLGIVQMDDARLTILDMKALRRYAEEPFD